MGLTISLQIYIYFNIIFLHLMSSLLYSKLSDHMCPPDLMDYKNIN